MSSSLDEATEPTDRGVGKRVLVAGAGVIGLTSALCIRRGGFEVTVVADRFAPHVTSVVAGALWEWPPAVCGQHHDDASLARSKSWAATSYEIFASLAGDPATGVFVRPVTFYFRGPIEDDPRQHQKLQELKVTVRQFRHDPALIAEHGVNPGIGLRDAFTHLAPMVDTDVYMRWLESEVRRAGCRIVEARITGSLRAQVGALAHQYGADAIINCAGLGAAELSGEALHPLRGALIRIRNDGRTTPRVTEAHCVSQGSLGMKHGFVFIVPRGEDTLLLGGLAEPDEWGLEIGLHNYEPIRDMYRRCVEFLPALRGAEIDAAEPVRVGLRPYRHKGVRLDREPQSRVIHNYGHGGSGVTFSWGCAQEVRTLVEQLLLRGNEG